MNAYSMIAVHSLQKLSFTDVGWSIVNLVGAPITGKVCIGEEHTSLKTEVQPREIEIVFQCRWPGTSEAQEQMRDKHLP